MENEKIIARLQKIKALIEHDRTSDTEKKHVQNQLDRIMRMYNVSENDILLAPKKEHGFRVKSTRERNLCTQVMACVVDSDFEGSYTYKSNKTKLITICTDAQAIEIDFLFDFYKKLYAEEENILFTAFYHKHGLHPSKPSDTGERPSDSMVARVGEMLYVLSDKKPVKQIGADNV